MNDTELKALQAEIAAKYATKAELAAVKDIADRAREQLAVAIERLDAISKSLEKMDGHMTWFVRTTLGAVLMALLALVLKG